MFPQRLVFFPAFELFGESRLFPEQFAFLRLPVGIRNALERSQAFPLMKVGETFVHKHPVGSLESQKVIALGSVGYLEHLVSLLLVFRTADQLVVLGERQ